MKRLTKNLILAVLVISSIICVDFSFVEASSLETENFSFSGKCNGIFFFSSYTEFNEQYLDFWGKFRDTVLPNRPQNNNPPKAIKKDNSKNPFSSISSVISKYFKTKR